MAKTALRFAPVTVDNWSDFETLFECPGAPKYCWCTCWRELPDRQTIKSADKKKVMAGIVGRGTPVGMLAYAGDEAVGWCSVAPRKTLRKLSPDQDDAETGVWSVGCFFVRKDQRGHGVAAALLDAAVAHAFGKGAECVEAYPVDPDSPSFRFMGFRDMFATRGFRDTGMAGSRRHVMRLDGADYVRPRWRRSPSQA